MVKRNRRTRLHQISERIKEELPPSGSGQIDETRFADLTAMLLQWAKTQIRLDDEVIDDLIIKCWRRVSQEPGISAFRQLGQSAQDERLVEILQMLVRDHREATDAFVTKMTSIPGFAEGTRFHGMVSEYQALFMSWLQKDFPVLETELEDLLQDFWIKLNGIGDEFRIRPHKDSFRPFARIVLRRMAIDRIRRRGRQGGQQLPEDLIAPKSMGDLLLEILGDRGKVEELLYEFLSPGTNRDRDIQIFLAVTFDERNGEDVAQEFGVRPPTVSRVKKLILSRLGNLLGPFR